MAAPIDFYFDFSSPYGYFAATRIDDIAHRHGRETVWRPILLGVVFKETGQQPLSTIPLKGEYALRDMARTARLLGIPYRPPTRFPVAGTAASRAYYWLAERAPAVAKRLARAVYHAYFAEDRDISSLDVVGDVAATLGIDRAALIEAATSAPVKEHLRHAVAAAIERGVFGSPYIVVDGEPFWGADRLDQVERWLATGGW